MPPTVADINKWWWTLDSVARADICTQLGGNLGDVIFLDPPDYLVEHIQSEEPNLIYEVS